MSDIKKGLLVQIDVVKALILRETRTRFGASNIGYLWALIEPVIWILTFYIAFLFLGKNTPYGTTLISFITSGLIPFLLFRQIVNNCMNAIDANKALLFYPQVKPLDLILARTLLEMTTISVIFLILIGLDLLLFHDYELNHLLNICLSLIFVSFIAMGIGTTFAAIAINFDSIRRIVPPIVRVLFFVSGIFYTPLLLGNNLHSIVMYNPISNAIEMLRSALFIGYQNEQYDVFYMLEWLLISNAVGLLLLRISQKKLELV
jgi:capsular polysaccharide transport system permease protein